MVKTGIPAGGFAKGVSERGGWSYIRVAIARPGASWERYAIGRNTKEMDLIFVQTSPMDHTLRCTQRKVARLLANNTTPMAILTAIKTTTANALARSSALSFFALSTSNQLLAP
jgi:hypothetical protein